MHPRKRFPLVSVTKAPQGVRRSSAGSAAADTLPRRTASSRAVLANSSKRSFSASVSCNIFLFLFLFACPQNHPVNRGAPLDAHIQSLPKGNEVLRRRREREENHHPQQDTAQGME